MSGRPTKLARPRPIKAVTALLALAAVLIGGCASNHPTTTSAPNHNSTVQNSTTTAARRKSTAFLFGKPRAKTACHPTAAQQAAADRLLAETKRDLTRLADLKTAEAEGYLRFGDVPIVGTWHYINWTYVADTHVLDPMHPESIIYWKQRVSSTPILIGAMYVMPHASDIGPQIGGCLTTWHVHGPPFAPAGRVTNEMLHVWLIPMPDGPFA